MPPLEVLPASYFQRLQHARSLNGRNGENDTTAWRLRGALDRRALHVAFAELSIRHDTLRTALRDVGGMVCQVVDPGQRVRLRLTDLRLLPGPRRGRALTRHALTELETPFDVAAGPLARALLVRLGERDHVLLVTVCHAIWDAWSERILGQELFAIYGALARGMPSPLRPPRLQYGDVAAWEAEADGAARRWWADRLRGHGPFLPGLSGGGPISEEVRLQPIPAVGPTFLRRLAATARAQRATPGMGLLAVFFATLAAWCGEQRLLISAFDANRDAAGLEDVLGFCAGGLLIPCEVEHEATFRSLVSVTGDRVREAYAHRLPIEHQSRLLRGDPGAPAMHEVLFNAIPDTLTGAEAHVHGLAITSLSTPRRRYSRDAAWHGASLILTLRTRLDGAVDGHVEHNAGRLAAADARTIGDLFRALLEDAALHPDDPLAALTDRARRRLASRTNRSRAADTRRDWSRLSSRARRTSP